MACGVIPGVDVRLRELEPGRRPGEVGNELGEGMAKEAVLLVWLKLRAVGLFLGRELFVIPFDGALSSVGPAGSAEVVCGTAGTEIELAKNETAGAGLESSSGVTVLRAELKLDSVPPLSSLRAGVASTGLVPSSLFLWSEDSSLSFSASLSVLF